MTAFPISTKVYQVIKAWAPKLSKLVSDFTDLLLPLEWGNYSVTLPTGLSNQPSYTDPQIYLARYFRLFDAVYFTVHGSIETTATTAGNNIWIPLPMPARFYNLANNSNQAILSGGIRDGGSFLGACAFVEGQKAYAIVRRYDAANLGVGTNREFAVSGWYEREVVR
jgi:hypothetical protein